MPGRYIVETVSKSQTAIRDLAQRIPEQANGRLIRVFDNVLGGFEVELSDAQAEIISNLPEIASVHEVALGRVLTVEDANTWGRDRVDEREPVFDQLYNYYFTAPNVTAYVLDTGVNAVGELAGRVAQHVNFTSDGYNGDCWPGGHGTQVASTIGGINIGIAKDIRIVDLKTVDCGDPNFAPGSPNAGSVIAALNWLVQDHDALELAVANISLVFDPNSQIDQAVRDAISDGVTVVSGAGNDGQDACLFSPGRVGHPNDTLGAITVAASDRDDHVSVWSPTERSSTGPCVDLFAPGGPELLAQGSGFWDQYWQGTSASAPHVTGMAALTLAKYGNIEPHMVESHLLDIATRNLITDNPASAQDDLLPGTPNKLLYHVTPDRRRACCTYP